MLFILEFKVFQLAHRKPKSGDPNMDLNVRP